MLSSYLFSLKKLLNLKFILLLCILLFFSSHAIYDLINKPYRIVTYVEIFIMISAAYLLVSGIMENHRMHTELTQVREKDSELSKQLQHIIDTKFNYWNFSPSEKKVATSLIQGYLIKEIAFNRGVSEKTIQSQLTAIYRKSSSKNRADFTTQFIQIMLEPQTQEK